MTLQPAHFPTLVISTHLKSYDIRKRPVSPTSASTTSGTPVVVLEVLTGLTLDPAVQRQFSKVGRVVGLGVVGLLAPRQEAALFVLDPRGHSEEIHDGDLAKPFVFHEQFGEIVGYGLVYALDVPLVYRDPDERGSERLGHREGRVLGGSIVAIEVPLVEHLIVVDDEERCRPARIEVVFETAVGTVAPDGLDLRGIRVVRGEFVEAGGGRRVVDDASGELLEVLVV